MRAFRRSVVGSENKGLIVHVVSVCEYGVCCVVGNKLGYVVCVECRLEIRACLCGVSTLPCRFVITMIISPFNSMINYGKNSDSCNNEVYGVFM